MDTLEIFDSNRLSVFGLGKLGCSMLACFAHKGFEVVGVDLVADTVEKINAGESPIYEPGVEAMIAANRSRIRATGDTRDAIRSSSVSFVIVPTPSLPNGAFSTEFVEAVVTGIGGALREKETFQLVVITSTVLPGDTMKLRQLLERTSGKVCGRDFGMCYNPDFIALGSIIRDFLNPDMILIGESDSRSGAILESIHRKLVESSPQVHRMNFYNAELAKITLNSYCTLKITFANKIAELCEKMPGGDASAVANAVGDDRRVGRRYFRGGLGFGGPCFPRDNRALAQSASRFGVEMPLAEVTDKINKEQKSRRIPNRVRALLGEGRNNVAVLGFTYKKDTPLVVESAVIPTIRALADGGVSVRIYDPAGMPGARRELGMTPGITFSDSATACADGADLIFLGTDWDEFRALDEKFFLEHLAPGGTVFDACGLFPNAAWRNVRLVGIGKAAQE